MLSPDVLAALGSGLASRYSHSMENGVNSYGGNDIFEKIFASAQANIARLFGSRYAEIRPTGGHIAVEAAILSACSKGDTILAVGPGGGGYPGYEQRYLPDMFSLRSFEIPYDGANQAILMEKMEGVVEEKRPNVVILGQSAFVRPYDLKHVAELSEKYGFRMIYDGSHVMGLIAGGEFQPDALRYCDILVGSTHKSFFGPQGGVALTNDADLSHGLEENITWRTMDNFHPNRIAALGIAAEEMLRHGREYAKTVSNNSRGLGKALDVLGVPVKFAPWYSYSHQVLLADPGVSYVDFSKRLESSGIIVDRDGRIGTSEISRMGYTDMETIADLIHRASAGNNVLEEVKALAGTLSIEFWR